MTTAAKKSSIIPPIPSREAQAFADRLRRLEADLAALDAQFARIPLRHSGAEEVLGGAVQACEAEWKDIIGRLFEPQGELAAEDVRRVLHAMGELSSLVGAALDVAPLEVRAEIWTDSEDLYAEKPTPSGTASFGAGHALPLYALELPRGAKVARNGSLSLR